ncbi:MAG: hypothetical protein Q9191_001943 [Dirinaria sp. TL-2023a]
MATRSVERIRPEAQVSWHLLQQLRDLFQDHGIQTRFNVQSSALDQLQSQFEIWGKNCKVFVDKQYPTSLEYRLQKAPFLPDLASQIWKRLQMMNRHLGQVHAIASGDGDERSSFFRKFLKSFSEEKRRAWKKVQKFANLAESPGWQSEAGVSFESARDSLDRLCGLLELIPVATHMTPSIYTDRCESFGDCASDVSLIGTLYPKIQQSEWLQKRLAQAIARRRHYLSKCREEHENEHNAEAKAQGNQQNAMKSNQEATETMPITDSRDTVGGLANDAKITPTVASILKSLRASKLDVPSELKEPLDDDPDNTSLASSVHEDANTGPLRVPDMPKEAETGQPFRCPYCYGLQQFRSRLAWKEHVFADLASYVCTVEQCESLDMFGRRDTWLQHELGAHHATWLCPICNNENGLYSNYDQFKVHMEELHGDKVTRLEIVELLLGARQLPQAIPASVCLFCDEWAGHPHEETTHPHFKKEHLHVDVDDYRRHVAKHLEQLALITLPGTDCDKNSSKAILSTRSSG